MLVLGGALEAEARGADGGDEAEDHQEGGGQLVEGEFEGREGHDTHLGALGWNPGGAGLSVWTLFR